MITYKTVFFTLITETGTRQIPIPVKNGTLYKLSKAGIDMFRLMSEDNLSYTTVVDAIAALVADEGVTKDMLLDQPPEGTNNILNCFMDLMSAYEQDMSSGSEPRDGGPDAGN